MSEVITAIRQRLFDLQDIKYKEFHSKLIPTVDTEDIIGVRTPELRKYARELKGTEEAEVFIRNLPHRYYEENNLHGFLLEYIRDYQLCIEELDRFLPCVDNWATCDMMNPKTLGRHLPELSEKVREWMASGHTYTIRYGIGMLMRYYLDEAFDEVYLSRVAQVKSDEYYVNMMIAWYYATALAKQYEAAIPYLEEYRLPKWIHNKTIQKAVESNRVPDSVKEYLRRLRVS